jgi:hypothetical protein
VTNAVQLINRFPFRNYAVNLQDSFGLIIFTVIDATDPQQAATDLQQAATGLQQPATDRPQPFTDPSQSSTAPIALLLVRTVSKRYPFN